MHSLDTIKSACQVALDTMDADPKWRQSYCDLADPASVLNFIHKVEAQNGPTRDELRSIGKLVRDLTGYIKMVSGDRPDPVRDDLLLQARQLLSLLDM